MQGIRLTLGRHKDLLRELILFSPVYFILALIDLRDKLFVTPAWFDGRLRDAHLLLLQFAYTNNEQSRLLQFLIPELFRKLFALGVKDAYILQRWVFIFLMLVCFHFYLRKWFGRAGAFAGVLFLAAVMPLAYQNDLQESSPLLLLTFVMGLWAIRSNHIPAIVIIFFIGALDNETMLILPLVYFFYNFKSRKLADFIPLVRNTILISLPVVVPIAIIRFINRDRPVNGGLWQLSDNLHGLLNSDLTHPYSASSWYFLIIFGAFWLYAFLRYKREPLFLRRASLIVPFFLLAHLFAGIITEVRLMLPLSFIIIPMALYFLFPSERDQPAAIRESPAASS